MTYPGWTDVLGQEGLVGFETDRLVLAYLMRRVFPGVLQQLVPGQAGRAPRRGGGSIVPPRGQQEGQGAGGRGMVVGRNEVDVDAGHAEQGLPLEAGRVEAGPAGAGVVVAAREDVEARAGAVRAALGEGRGGQDVQREDLEELADGRWDGEPAPGLGNGHGGAFGAAGWVVLGRWWGWEGGGGGRERERQ